MDNSNQESKDEFSFLKNPELKSPNQLMEGIVLGEADSFQIIDNDGNEGDDLSDEGLDDENEILDDENEIDLLSLISEKFENRDVLKKDIIAWACLNPLHVPNPIYGMNLNRKDYLKSGILHIDLQIFFPKI